MKKRTSTALIIGGVASLGLGALLIVNLTRGKTRGIVYQETTVKRDSIRQTVLSTGSVDSENRLELKPPIAGRIERILVQEGNSVRKGQVLAWMSSTERAGLLDTARAKGPAELKYWEDAYKATPIIAPINGIIILKNVEQGQTVTANEAVVVMSDRLIVKARVDETDIAEIKIGQPAEIVLDAFPKHTLSAKVVHIAFDAKTVNNVTTYEVDVLPDGAPPYMKSGMTTNVSFVLAVKADALIVPAASVRKENGKTSVLVPAADKGGEPSQREVEIGITDGKKVEILSGLEEGDRVLIAAAGTTRKGRSQNSNPFSPMGVNKGAR